MRKYILQAMALIAMAFSFNTGRATATTSVTSPDFAYPKTVSANAKKQLAEAIKSGNDINAIRALMDLGLAQGAISTDNLPEVIATIQSTEQRFTDPCSKALTNTLLAEIYYEIYRNSKYTFDRRQLPLHPMADKYDEWSGDQFKYVIDSLFTAASGNVNALQAAPLGRYSSIITADATTLIYYPTLYDFVMQRYVTVYQDCYTFQRCLATKWLVPETEFITMSTGGIPSPAARKMLQLYASWLKANANRTAPLINIDIQRIQFTANNAYNNADDNLTRLYHELYQRYSHSEFSGNALIEWASTISYFDTERSRAVIDNINAFASRFPAFHRLDCLKALKDNLLRAAIQVNVDNIVAPNLPFNIKISATNVQRATVKIYRIKGLHSPFTSYANYTTRHPANDLEPVKTIPVVHDQPLPFAFKDTIQATVDQYGHYLVNVTIDGERPSTEISGQVMFCTEMAVSKITGNENIAVVVDAITGKPIEGASIQYAPQSRTSKVASYNTLSGATNRDGFITIPPSSKESRIYSPLKGDDRYAPFFALYYTPRQDSTTHYTASIYTDLAIYHPGDSVGWVALVYSYNKSQRHPVANQSVEAIIRNANYTAIDTVRASTDQWGRIAAYSYIPKGDLTGTYTIELKSDEGKNLSSTAFTVSDYKMPTYEIVDLRTINGQPGSGDVTIKGMVRTYSGMPLSGCSVTVNILSAESYWYRNNGTEFHSATVATDANGEFSLPLSADLLSNAPYATNLFQANVVATSLSGESHQQSITFSVGQCYSIVASLPSEIDTANPVRLDVKVIDGEGKDVIKSLTLTIENGNDVVYTTSVSTASPTVDLRNVASGSYTIKLSLDSLTTTSHDVILYRPTDPQSPVDAPLWTPLNKITLQPSQKKATVLFAAADDDTHILYIVSDGLNILQQKWTTVGKGFHTLNIDIPQSIGPKATITLTAYKNFNSSSITIPIVRLHPEAQMDIRVESFRDKVVPGSRETLTFTTINGLNNPLSSAMILGIYNTALDNLANNPWRLIPAGVYQPSLQLSLQSRGIIHSEASSFDKTDYRCVDITSPIFNTYGRNFYGSRQVYHMGPVYAREYKSANLMAAPTAGLAVSEDSYEMPLMNSAMAVSGEGVATEDAVENDMDNGSSHEPTKDAFEYRPAETPLALFRPMLHTDAEGRLSVTFTVPNANTSWTMQAIAYDNNMLAATITRRFIASKPVMVQPNMPRFLRTGDVATIASTVMNNSSEPLTVTVTAETFNPVNDEIVSTTTDTLTLEPNASTSIASTLAAPMDAPFIGFRIKASTDRYADGEQSLIPVLPSSSPVIETMPFYLPADSTDFTFTLPTMPADARVTLQYCDNPTWYCITALSVPGATDFRSAPQAAEAIFTAAMAKGLLADNPNIASALKEWTSSNRSDSTLISMLQRNADLKTLLLQATPWMMDAQSDTERMSRLSLLLDAGHLSSVISSATATLQKLQRNDGGWAWMDYATEPSEWATYSTLSTLGQLNRFGYMPTDKSLSAMTRRALNWHEKLTEKQYRKYPKQSYVSYAMLRQLWPDVKQSATGKQITAATVQKLIKSWKQTSMTEKPQIAMLLHSQGYTRTATEVLNSMRQYAISSPTKGMWWPSLEGTGIIGQLNFTASALMAFHTIQPGCAEINPIRQWLILQKEALNWGDNATTARIVASIVATSPKWLERASQASITLGHNPIDVSYSDAILGYFRTDISSLHPSDTPLAISHPQPTPAWGAVYAQFIQSMDSIKAASCEDLSIEKRLFVKDGTEWVAVDDSLSVGQKVKVQLLIRATRAIEYVAITDERPACFEPIDQLPGYIYAERLGFYRENRDASTNIFITALPKGTYLLEYEIWVNNAGRFSSGIATIQSQYAPELSAHSSGTIINAKN